MNFSTLPEEIKIKIFNLLNIGSRFNASLVWEEMAEMTWKSISVDEELTNRLEDTNNKTRLEDVETAGVLAFTDHLESNLCSHKSNPFVYLVCASLLMV